MACPADGRFGVQDHSHIFLGRRVSYAALAVEDANVKNALRGAYSFDCLLYQKLLKGEHAVAGAFFDIVYKRIAVLDRVLKQFFFLMPEKKIPEESASDNHQCADGEEKFPCQGLQRFFYQHIKGIYII
jgi:hypothetical protein